MEGYLGSGRRHLEEIVSPQSDVAGCRGDIFRLPDRSPKTLLVAVDIRCWLAADAQCPRKVTSPIVGEGFFEFISDHHKRFFRPLTDGVVVLQTSSVAQTSPSR